MSELGFYVTTTTGKKVRIIGSENGGPLGSILVDTDGGKWRRTGSASQVSAVAPPPTEEPTAAPEADLDADLRALDAASNAAGVTDESVLAALAEADDEAQLPDADAAGEAGSDTVEDPQAETALD